MIRIWDAGPAAEAGRGWTLLAMGDPKAAAAIARAGRKLEANAERGRGAGRDVAERAREAALGARDLGRAGRRNASNGRSRRGELP